MAAKLRYSRSKCGGICMKKRLPEAGKLAGRGPCEQVAEQRRADGCGAQRGRVHDRCDDLLQPIPRVAGAAQRAEQPAEKVIARRGQAQPGPKQGDGRRARFGGAMRV